MSDTYRRYRAIKRAMMQFFQPRPTGHREKHLNTLCALICGLAGGKHAHPASREVGDDRRGEPDERQLAQRHAGAPIGERKQPAGHDVHFAHHWMNRT